MMIDVNTIVLVGGFCITILTFLNTQRRNQAQEVAERTKMYTKIDASCAQTNEILRSVDKMTDRFDEVASRQTRHDEQIRTLYKQDAKLDERVSKLEGK